SGAWSLVFRVWSSCHPMRDPHAKCVKISRALGVAPAVFFGFRPKTAVAPSLLKTVSNQVDSVNGWTRLRVLSAKTKHETSKDYEKRSQKNRGFHSYRVVSRYCHHRHPGGP